MAVFSALEIFQSRIFLILTIAALGIPLFGLIVASLFMMDLGKVYYDVLIAGSNLTSIVYCLFVCGHMLAKDIENQICHLFITAPMQRWHYQMGRFLGITFVFLILTLTLGLGGALGAMAYMNEGAVILEVNPLWAFAAAGFVAFQYLSILGGVFFIASWATGLAEIMFFSFAFVAFSWTFPPILEAMRMPEVMERIPADLATFVQALYGILPHLNSYQFAVMLPHGHLPDARNAFWFALEHIAYAGAGLSLAFWFFRRRDL